VVLFTLFRESDEDYGLQEMHANGSQSYNITMFKIAKTVHK
jgi:hypothetical protein